MSHQTICKATTVLICLFLTVACQQASSQVQINKTPSSSNPSEQSNQSSQQITPKPNQRSFIQYSSEQRDCWNLLRSTQIEAVRCAESDLNTNQVRLASLVGEIKNKLNDPQNKSPAVDLPVGMAEQLDTLQIKWGELVEMQCKWESNFLYGNSSAPMAYISCMATKTKDRLQQLRVFLCEGQGSNGLCKNAEKY